MLFRPSIVTIKKSSKQALPALRSLLDTRPKQRNLYSEPYKTISGYYPRNTDSALKHSNGVVDQDFHVPIVPEGATPVERNNFKVKRWDIARASTKDVASMLKSHALMCFFYSRLYKGGDPPELIFNSLGPGMTKKQSRLMIKSMGGHTAFVSRNYNPSEAVTKQAREFLDLIVQAGLQLTKNGDKLISEIAMETSAEQADTKHSSKKAAAAAKRSANRREAKAVTVTENINQAKSIGEVNTTIAKQLDDLFGVEGKASKVALPKTIAEHEESLILGVEPEEVSDFPPELRKTLTLAHASQPQINEYNRSVVKQLFFDIFGGQGDGAELKVALLTLKINRMLAHAWSGHRMDYDAKRKIVEKKARRRKLLLKIRSRSITNYFTLIKMLGIPLQENMSRIVAFAPLYIPPGPIKIRHRSLK